METETGFAPTGVPKRGKSFIVALLIVGGVTLAFAMVIRQSTPGSTTGNRAPEIQAAGWLNGPGPTSAELHGKVIVLDAWAFWCGPCRAQAPELVALYKRYRERGVVFVGLTGEGAAAQRQSQQFLQATNITWPNAYGARFTLAQLKNKYIPQTWVIDRSYNLIWDSSIPSEPIEAAIDRALAEKP